MANTENKDARAIANDLHDDLLTLQALVHAMDCIAYSAAFRGTAANDLDCEATGFLSVLGHEHVRTMQEKIEQLRYAVTAPDCPSCVAAVDVLQAETTERTAND